MTLTSKGSQRAPKSLKSLKASPILTRAVYRSRLEDRIAQQLQDAGVPFSYESKRVEYVVPARKARYTPDFLLANDRMLIEAKGYFRPSDRQKLVLIKEQHPDLDIRLVFSKAENKINKNSPTTYAKWCESHGFKYASGGKIPEEWLKEAIGNE